MINSKNYLNFKSKKTTEDTFKKIPPSVPKIDGVVKIEKLSVNKNIKTLVGDEKSELINKKEIEKSSLDGNRRLFLKVAGIAGLGMAASAILPKQANAYVAGSTPTSNVVGLKNESNNRINPATEESIESLLSGQGVNKLSVNLSSSGNVHTPTAGKKIRLYASRFSLTANATSVSFRFTSSGTDHEKYVSPKTGGLYGANNHPNYIEGGVDQVLYCVIDGTTTIQINIDYLEV